MKGENVFFGIGSTDKEMAKSFLTGQQVRVWCHATPSTTSAPHKPTRTPTTIASGLPTAKVLVLPAASNLAAINKFKDTIMTFYLMADSPYGANERKNLMPAHIVGIGTDAEFLIHLGDLQNAQEDNCKKWAY